MPTASTASGSVKAQPTQFHPEQGAVPGEIRWVMAHNPFDNTGHVIDAPDGFANLQASGALDSAQVCAYGVVTRSRIDADSPGSLQTKATQIRQWLTAALQTPGQWQLGSSPKSALDTQLTNTTNELLAGEIGEYARSHGGNICLNCVEDGVVHVNLKGACDGCPAAVFSLQLRLAKRIREANPALVAVVADPE